jgi:hypothetical protein
MVKYGAAFFLRAYANVTILPFIITLSGVTPGSILSVTGGISTEVMISCMDIKD